MSATPQLNPPDRRGADRRKRPTPMLSRYTLTGRRRGGRRAGERSGVYVDRPSWTELGMIAGLGVLTTLDAFLTLAHLERGGTEANPIMAAALDAGGYAGFLAAKMSVTVLALGFLLLHVRFRFTKRLLIVCLVIYGLLMLVHVEAIRRAVP